MLVIILVILLFCGGIGSFPAYGYNSHWGYGPFSGIIGLIILLLILRAFGVF